MKKNSLFLLLISAAIAANAQVSTELNNLLNSYYAVKNALVSGDALKAGNQAADFLKALNKISTTKLSPAAQPSFQQIQSSLEADAKSIASNNDINKQRENFASLSKNMITLAQSASLAAQPVYVLYCPMKKAYWLNADQVIKNPYYGSSMLSCGSVKDSIQ